MKTVIRKVGFISLATLTSLEQTFADGASMFGWEKISEKIKGTPDSADVAVQNIVGNIMFFLGIIAVIYGVYGGFLILTAGGEDDKVKKGKSIIIQVTIGLVVIFLANSIVQWILTKILSNA